MSVATLPPKRDQGSDQDQDQEPEPGRDAGRDAARAGWPSWIVPPVEGFKAEDLDHLPDLPRRTELRNGGLVFVSPQAFWHDSVKLHLAFSLRQIAPPEWRVATEMGVRLAYDTQREPDVLVYAKEAYGLSRTFLTADDVLVAVEIESPDSIKRDRFEKPGEYAAVGIPHFWRVERDDEATVVHAYRLAEDGAYAEVGVFRDRLVLDQPFPLDIPLADIP